MNDVNQTAACTHFGVSSVISIFHSMAMVQNMKLTQNCGSACMCAIGVAAIGRIGICHVYLEFYIIEVLWNPALADKF